MRAACSITLYCGHQRHEYATDPAFVWIVAIRLQVRPMSALLRLTQRGAAAAPVIALLLHADSAEPALVDATDQPLRARPLATVLQAWTADEAGGQLLPSTEVAARAYKRLYDAVEPLADRLEVVLRLETNPLLVSD